MQTVPVGVVGVSGYSGLELSRRSEEHTSELQSHVNLVCRLLLEKKKKQRLRTRRDRDRTQPKHTATRSRRPAQSLQSRTTRCPRPHLAADPYMRRPVDTFSCPHP